MDMARKMIALNRDSREMELWEEAERQARQELGSGAREGEVLAKICADYLEISEPLFPEAKA